MAVRLNWNEKFRFLCFRILVAELLHKKLANFGWNMKEKNINKS
jgi:hypothetical protein